MPFSNTWAALQQQLYPGLQLQTPSQGQPFTVDSVAPESITITTSTGEERTITKGEFEDIYDAWIDYHSGKKDKKDIVATNFDSSYIFGIYYWLQQQFSGSLP